MDKERLEKLRKEHTRFLIKDGKITRISSWDADSLDSTRKYRVARNRMLDVYVLYNECAQCKKHIKRNQYVIDDSHGRAFCSAECIVNFYGVPEVLTDEFHIKREDLVGRPMIKDQVVNFPPETIVDMRLRREFKIAYAGPNNRGIRDSTVISYWGEEVFYRSTGIRPEHGIATFSSEGVKIREFSTSSDPDDDPRNRE
jgi:hypothetical protein